MSSQTKSITFIFSYRFLILTSNIYVHRLRARIEHTRTAFTNILIRIPTECCSVVCPF